VGHNAMSANLTGSGNSALGVGALRDNTVGVENSALGLGALRGNTTGESNSAIGSGAMQHNQDGSDNVALGHHALEANSSGSFNVALGDRAGAQLTNGDNNIDIAHQGNPGEEGTIRIGSQGTQVAAFLAGVAGTNIGANPAVVVNGEGQLGVEASSRRFKTDIQPIGARAERLMRLRPVSFRYKRATVAGADRAQYGLLAEQVARVYPSLVVRGRDGRPYTVLYQELPTLLLAQVQRQQLRIGSQQRRLGAQRRAIARQGRHMQRLQAQMARLARQVRSR
ncbi:MAG TPA: tail fiber domain-containing protein, partial [Solirubrobacterales bacterium]|nr:tail fiber domain-containing protein [Solirubrobacterales bacterium]